jgi:hypothetical protein
MEKQDEMINALHNAQQKTLGIFQQKNHDYDSSFSTFGVIGIIIRMQDKLCRLLSLLSKDQRVVSESYEDTCLDLINYAAMAIMILCNEEPYDMIYALKRVHEHALFRLTNDRTLCSSGDKFQTIRRLQNELLSCLEYTPTQVSLVAEDTLENVCYRTHIIVSVLI